MNLYSKARVLSCLIYGMEFDDAVARDAICELSDLCEEIAAAVEQLEAAKGGEG